MLGRVDLMDETSAPGCGSTFSQASKRVEGVYNTSVIKITYCKGRRSGCCYVVTLVTLGQVRSRPLAALFPSAAVKQEQRIRFDCLRRVASPQLALRRFDRRPDPLRRVVG